MPARFGQPRGARPPRGADRGGALTDAAEASARVDGVDAARGLALIGMFLAHAAPAAASVTGAELLAIADERPRLLFALTAGIALGLISGGIRPIPAAPGFGGGPARARLRRQITIRALLLIALGLGITFGLAPLVFVILDVYGVAFLVLLPLLFLPRGVALGVGIAGAALAPGIAVAVSRMPWVAEARLAGWGLPVDWFFAGAYPVIEWVPVMLVGIALARYGITRPRLLAWTALLGTLAAVVFLPPGVALLRLGERQQTEVVLADEALRALALGESLQVLGNVGVCALIVAAAVALTAPGILKAEGARRVAAAMLSPITAMGAMPLTIYTAHLLVLAASIRVENGYRTDDSWPLTIGLILGSMVLAWCWRKWIGRGPLEQLLRWASGRTRPA
ncbi:heparan-alpha-glucosaminide N-acetyltransferase domain-containing protein [Agromyces sp. G08B096]|uniref:Heparan-alpha-glucosaminide N-acetyltransferase domain-containing protein n=1 Tax=Agromyces sp. G08B096 TaxID=3156399 RepID=A0AAU7WBM3_9MICO